MFDVLQIPYETSFVDPILDFDPMDFAVVPKYSEKDDHSEDRIIEQQPEFNDSVAPVNFSTNVQMPCLFVGPKQPFSDMTNYYPFRPGNELIPYRYYDVKFPFQPTRIVFKNFIQDQ